jgi:hypothetical protein
VYRPGQPGRQCALGQERDPGVPEPDGRGPEAEHQRERAGTGDGECAVPLGVAGRVDDLHQALADDDEHEQAEPLGEVRDVGVDDVDGLLTGAGVPPRALQPGGDGGQQPVAVGRDEEQQVEPEADRPEHVLRGALEPEGHDPRHDPGARRRCRRG